MADETASFDDPTFYFSPADLAAIIARADAIEVGGCHDIEEDGSTFAEPCDDAEATYWSAYAHVPGEGASCLHDFRTRADAEAYAASFGLPVIAH